MMMTITGIQITLNTCRVTIMRHDVTIVATMRHVGIMRHVTTIVAITGIIVVTTKELRNVQRRKMASRRKG